MKTAAATFAAAGLLLLGYGTVECTRTRLFQAREVRQFDAAANAPAPPERSRPLLGSAIARIDIARLGMSAVVVEGAEKSHLKLGPGHILGTALPGEGGNVAFAGHRDTFFRPLRFARTGDTIDVRAAGREFRYRIVSTQVVAPGDVRSLRPTPRETLTLVTCYPFYFVGAAPQRFIIQAECVECPRRPQPEERRLQ